jgi:hypothetical protein
VKRIGRLFLKKNILGLIFSTIFSREKIDSLKEKIRQMNIEAGALAIRKVDIYFALVFLINIKIIVVYFSFKKCMNN